MDPDANITEQRALAAHLLETSFEDDSADWTAKAVRLADLVSSLDTWLSTGGAFPVLWTTGEPLSE